LHRIEPVVEGRELNREDLPEEFDVSLAGAKHRGRLIWRARLHVGIQFMSTG
jgi:hypothetical protein